MRYLAILLLASCNTLGDLEAQYDACMQAFRTDCEPLYELVENRRQAIKRREGCQICPNGLVDLHIDERHEGCYTARQMRDSLERQFRGRQF
jgi:hypothetical protein